MKQSYSSSNVRFASSKVLLLVLGTSSVGYGLIDPEPLRGPNAEGGCTSIAPLPPRDADEMPVADYVVTVNPSFQWVVNGQVNPTLTLNRDQTYQFDLTGFGGQHPFVINQNAANAGGTIYLGPSSGSLVNFTPTMAMPNTIYYHCTVHFTTMVGTINLVTPADYTVSVHPSLLWVINGEQNPTLTLNRGESYSFNLSAVGGQHPFVINSNAANAGGTVYLGPTSGTTVNFTPDFVMPSTIYYHCTVHFTTMVGTINLVTPPILVSVKALLEGPFDQGTLRMKDDLRVAGYVPTTEPYTALGYVHVNGGGGETINPSVLTVTGDNAIVDWVEVELRDNVTPATRVATRSALIQRDGDVVSTDGTSPVAFSMAPGTYRVALRHRSHLGIMTLNGVTVTGTTTTVDFTTATTATFGTNAQTTLATKQCMWMGDESFDGVLKYTGANNDRDPILVSIGGTVPTNTAPGYLSTDLNLDGVTKYTGAANDRDPILVNIGGTVPTNTRTAQLP